MAPIYIIVKEVKHAQKDWDNSSLSSFCRVHVMGSDSKHGRCRVKMRMR
jgi:hypothetical protein